MVRGVVPVWFATADYPEAHRLDRCREVIGAVLGAVEIDPLGDLPFQAQTVGCALPGVDLLTCFVSRCRACRHAARPAAGGVVLARPMSGGMTVCQRGREIAVRPGEAVLIATDAPWSCDVSAADRVDYMILSREALRYAIGDLDTVLLCPVPSDNAAMLLLVHYAGALMRGMLPLRSPEQAQLAVTHMQDLVALMFRTSGDEDLLGTPNVRHARLNAIKADIEGALAQRDLSAETIARRHGITPRYVQKLFEEEGTTFTAFVLERRLERARRLLARPDARTISSIAYEVGFNDLSYFNRTFRRQFGAAPSAMRQTTRGEN